jgi:hypothetical protein
MVLTDRERKFLAAFVREATTDPFMGPATDELHRREIYYTDLPHLLAAYYWETLADQDDLGGKCNSSPPPCPWHDRESALRRDQEVEHELHQAESPIAP